MKTFIVGIITFVVMVTLFWGCGGFISGVWNPMSWLGIGRLMLVLCVLGIGGPVAVCTALGYHEEVERKQRRGY